MRIEFTAERASAILAERYLQLLPALIALLGPALFAVPAVPGPRVEELEGSTLFADKGDLRNLTARSPRCGKRSGKGFEQVEERADRGVDGTRMRLLGGCRGDASPLPRGDWVPASSCSQYPPVLFF